MFNCGDTRGLSTYDLHVVGSCISCSSCIYLRVTIHFLLCLLSTVRNFSKTVFAGCGKLCVLYLLLKFWCLFSLYCRCTVFILHRVSTLLFHSLKPSLWNAFAEVQERLFCLCCTDIVLVDISLWNCCTVWSKSLCAPDDYNSLFYLTTWVNLTVWQPTARARGH
jgi:hypothetical protein